MKNFLKPTWVKLLLWIAIYILFEKFLPIFDSHFWELDGFSPQAWIPIKALGIFIPYILASIIIASIRKGTDLVHSKAS